MSPVAKGGKALAAAAAVTLPHQLSGGHLDRTRLLIDVSVAVLIVVAGVVSWLVTRWRVDGGELQLETGLIRRQSIRVPLSRVQAIDVVRPLIARILGISELRLVMAGSGSGKAALAYLPEGRALEVRLQLLGLGQAPAADAAPALIEPLAAVPNHRLVASALLGPASVLITVAVTAVVAAAVLAPQAVLPLLAATAPIIFGAAASLSQRVNAEFSFSIGQSPDGLCLYSGLLQTRAETIPVGRVQAVRLVEPWLWRPLGWCRLEIDVAQQSHGDMNDDLQALTAALLPVGSRAEADRLLARVLPGAAALPPSGSAPPTQARLKAPLSYRNLAAWYDADYVAARTGRLQKSTVVMPRHKVQSVRWTQGPLQRRLQLATVHVDTAGRHWQALARDRDEDNAQSLLWELTTAGSAHAPQLFARPAAR